MSPVLANKTEFGKYVRNENYTPKQITKMPKQFEQWMEKNNNRIEISNNRGTLPNFIKDNSKYAGIRVNLINTAKGKNIIKDAIKKYNSYGDEWEKAYFDEKSGGFTVYHKEHQFTKTGGGGEAEKIVGKMLAKYNGKQVEFLPEGEKKSPDIEFDGQKWDIKYIDNANEKTIRGYIEDARKADNVIFYFTKKEKYELLNNAIEREKGKFLKEQSSKIPDMYFIDKNKLLRLIWKK